MKLNFCYYKKKFLFHLDETNPLYQSRICFDVNNKQKCSNSILLYMSWCQPPLNLPHLKYLVTASIIPTLVKLNAKDLCNVYCLSKLKQKTSSHQVASLNNTI